MDTAIIIIAIGIGLYLLHDVGILRRHQRIDPRRMIPPAEGLPRGAGWGIQVTHRTGEWYVSRRGAVWSWSPARRRWVVRRAAPREVLALANLARESYSTEKKQSG